MLVTDEGMVMLVKPVQPENALLPMLVTEYTLSAIFTFSGMVTAPRLSLSFTPETTASPFSSLDTLKRSTPSVQTSSPSAVRTTASSLPVSISSTMLAKLLQGAVPAYASLLPAGTWRVHVEVGTSENAELLQLYASGSVRMA